jgi:selenocysteine lyase/cysteine desulfurase
VRVSTHFYNTLREVERLLEAVRRIAANPLDYV